jgi:polysaccharide pyruvyl transferase WcaK-like protein
VQNGEHWLRNNGDLAMLHVTLSRLQARWPQARIDVLTSSPALLRAYAPGARPIGDGRLPSPSALPSVDRLIRRLGPAAVGPAAVAGLAAQQRTTQVLDRLRRLPYRLAGRPAPARRPVASGLPVHDRVVAALQDASLVLAMGGGYLTDVDPAQTLRTFGVLARAVEAGVPTALVGQGLGPLTDPALLAHAQRVLPHVDFIGLREGRKGPKLLAELGVPANRIQVTGDDAVELGYSVRQPSPGSDLGICLRVADYSPVATQAKETVGRVVRTAAAREGAALVPLIISEYRSEDRRSTLPLVAGYPGVVPPLGRYVHARAVAERVSRCRVLVTGAYHLAVFALSQGIPVVGLTSSAYYDDKFLGLADMFGGGLRLVGLGEPDLDVVLRNAINSQWQHAPALRDSLQARAVVQIQNGTELFGRIFELVEARLSA